MVVSFGVVVRKALAFVYSVMSVKASLKWCGWFRWAQPHEGGGEGGSALHAQQLDLLKQTIWKEKEKFDQNFPNGIGEDAAEWIEDPVIDLNSFAHATVHLLLEDEPGDSRIPERVQKIKSFWENPEASTGDAPFSHFIFDKNEVDKIPYSGKSFRQYQPNPKTKLPMVPEPLSNYPKHNIAYNEAILAILQQKNSEYDGKATLVR